MPKWVVIGFVVAVMLPGAVMAGSTCNIAQEKKDMIRLILCDGPAPEYRFTGEGCVLKAAQKRNLDSATQAYFFRLCGDSLFAEKLIDGFVKINKFVETLAICSSETIDMAGVFNDAMEQVSRRSIELACTSEIRRKLEERRPELRRMIETGTDPSLVAEIYQKIGIQVDDAGNVTDN